MAAGSSERAIAASSCPAFRSTRDSSAPVYVIVCRGGGLAGITGAGLSRSRQGHRPDGRELAIALLEEQ